MSADEWRYNLPMFGSLPAPPVRVKHKLTIKLTGEENSAHPHHKTRKNPDAAKRHFTCPLATLSIDSMRRKAPNTMNTIITDSICLPFDLSPRASRCLERWLNLRVRRGGELPHLVFAGTLFQAAPPARPPREVVLGFFETNLGLLAALRAWGGAGGALTIVAEDDPVLGDDEAWSLLCELLPTLNAQVSRAPMPLAGGTAS